MIQKANSIHIPQIVKLHIENLPDDFLPSLGDQFLRILYSCFFKSKYSIIYVHKNNNYKITGFTFAAIDTKELYKDIFRCNLLILTRCLSVKIIKDVGIVFKLISTALFILKELFNKNKPKSEILAIVTEKKYQRKGIGHGFIVEFEKYLRKQNIKSYSVKTLKQYKGANNFYKKNEFKYISSFTLYNKQWNVYNKKL